MWCEFKINFYTIHFIFTFKIVQLVGHIHNQSTFFWTQDSQTLLYYLPNIKFTWNKFKWKILNNLNYDNLCGDGDFSHAYVIMHRYFGEKPKIKKEYISFYVQFDVFSCMKISYTCCQHLGPQTLNLMNIEWLKKGIIFLATFSKWIQWPLKLLCHIFNQMHYMNIAKLYRCMHYLSMTENLSQLHCLIFFFITLRWKL
jgi:hypothetical protein